MTMSGPPSSLCAYFLSPEQREIIRSFMQSRNIKMHLLNSNLVWELTA